MRRVWSGFLLGLGLALGASFGSPAGNTGAPGAGAVWVLTVKGAIGPATAEFLRDGLADAAAAGAALMVIQLDTPGGLDSAMRDIIRAVLGSPVPVAVYVAPQGARAASAGTYLLYAAHIAAMAPATNLGAATPVQLGEPPKPPERPGAPEPHGAAEGGKADDREKGRAGRPVAEAGGALERKAVNDAAAYLRALAELRGRNAEWADKAVREAASLSAEQAAAMGVIDLIAPDLDALLAALDGRRVRLDGGREVVLALAGAPRVTVEPDWRIRLLSVLTDPNVAYMLMMLGLYGLIYEFINPGMIVPGVIGGICLLLGLYALQVLPVNYAGLALMLLGIAFMVGEAFAPSFGILGLGGVVAFTIGSVILLDEEGYAVSLPLILGNALAALLLFGWVVGMLIRLRRRPPLAGREELVGAEVVAEGDFEGEGYVRVRGELWKARSASPVRRGQRLRVTRVDGLRLEVEPLADGAAPDPSFSS
ncbi:MAG: hypothetical protein KatS3mg121_1033 [Gammaproteobacteria bacterium]|nr:MAG: hypothetical protein KatS3mg121_1033 [Gammaproteobacteria bacterium]